MQKLSCSNCGRVYNLSINELKPINDNICDYCGKSLIKRKDDNSDTYDIRYQEYIEDTEPIINYYREKKLLYIVDGNKDKETIHQQIIDIVNKHKKI